MIINSLRCHIPSALFRAEQVRQLDAFAIAEMDGGGYGLMYSAGQAAFAVLRNLFPACRNLSVICGGGNNGGDGYVVAELALQAGFQVQLLAVADPEKLQGEAQQAYLQAVAAGVVAERWSDNVALSGEVIIDALLGTGLSGDVRADYARVIERVNDAPSPVLAIDIPSGLSADAGVPLGPTVKAAATVTFIALKQGLLTGEAVDYTGELWFDDLKVPAAVYDKVAASAKRVDLKSIRHWLPGRKPSSHKGQFGHVLIIGGERGYGGAAILAAEAALVAGAGRVSCATRAEHLTAGLSRCPDIMYRDGEQRSTITEMISKADVIVLGPGLGNEPWAQMCSATALASGRPLVIDADGLNLLAEHQILGNPVAKLSANSIITPHPGEAARLLSSSTIEVNQDRFNAAHKLAETYTCTALLKGFGTVIAPGPAPGDDRQVQQTEPMAVVSGHGNPGMAKAGMGDVLAGVTGALLAQNPDSFGAARFAACWHALAADWILEETGEYSLSASQVINALGPSLLGFEGGT